MKLQWTAHGGRAWWAGWVVGRGWGVGRVWVGGGGGGGLWVVGGGGGVGGGGWLFRYCGGRGVSMGEKSGKSLQVQSGFCPLQLGKPGNHVEECPLHRRKGLDLSTWGKNAKAWFTLGNSRKVQKPKKSREICKVGNSKSSGKLQQNTGLIKILRRVTKRRDSERSQKRSQNLSGLHKKNKRDHNNQRGGG